MKVNGSAVLHAPREAVWQALTDPAVLVRTIPGCLRLEETAPDAYKMTVTAGVASIKGTYAGQVRLSEQREPTSFVLHGSGAGTPGTVSVAVAVTLNDGDDGGTRLDYDADAVIGGMIGGVGQRMLASVATRTAGEFFAAVDDVLTGVVSVRADDGSGAGSSARGSAPAGAVADQRGVYDAPASTAGRMVPYGDFGRGLVTGAAIAVVGVVIGGWIAGRGHRRSRHLGARVQR